MRLEIVQVGTHRLPDYASIPSRFIVTSILQVELVAGGLGGILLHPQAVEKPYLKDYDSYGELPLDWPRQFDVTNWGFFLASIEGSLAGAAAVAFDTPAVNTLDGRRDLSVLWDLRVHPSFRGVGIPLFRHAAAWSAARGCRQMKVETQNVNLPACRFYQRMGCRLGDIRRFAYASLPSLAAEVQLIWYLDLPVP